MTYSELHTLADRIAREERLTHSEALSRLGRAGARKRNYGRVTLDRSVAGQLEPFAKPRTFWWCDREDAP